jgi:hypothetical protein
MNPALFALLAEKNAADIEAIVAKIGIPTLLAIAPHLYAILTTIQQQGKTS